MFAMRFKILAMDPQGSCTSLDVGPAELRQPSRCCGCLKHCKPPQSLLRNLVRKWKQQQGGCTNCAA